MVVKTLILGFDYGAYFALHVVVYSPVPNKQCSRGAGDVRAYDKQET